MPYRWRNLSPSQDIGIRGPHRRGLIHTSANLRPDTAAGILNVELHGQANPVSDSTAPGYSNFNGLAMPALPSGARRCEPNNCYFEGLVPSKYQGHHLLRNYLSFFLFLVA